MVDDLEIKVTPRHEDQDDGVEIQQIASVPWLSSGINGLSAAIDDVNRRHSPFESVLRAGGRFAGPKVECGKLNKNPMAIATKCLMQGARQT